METCNFFTNHDDRLGYHFNPEEKYYEFKPTIRDKLHALVAQYMESKHNCCNDKEPTSNGLCYIPQNVKKQMLKEMRSTTTDSLLVYDIKLPSLCASDAQHDLMKSFVDLKDNSVQFPAQFPKDRPPPHLTIPRDDLQNCQFAIELRKELMSPSSTLRVVVRLPTPRGQKRHAHNIKLVEELLRWSTSVYCAQTISQVKFMSDDDTLKLYATYLGSCDNCIADGTVCAMKASFNNDNGNTGDVGRVEIGANDGAGRGGGDDDTSMSGCESTVGKAASDMDTDVDEDDDDDGNDDIAVDTDDEDDDVPGLVIDDRKCDGGGDGGVPTSQLGGGRDLDLGGVPRFGVDGENNAPKSSSSSLENNAPSLVRFDATTPGVGEAVIIEGVKDCAKPTIKQLSIANKRYPKTMVNSCTFSDKPPMSYRNTLEYARIVAVDVHSDGTTHTHYAHYGQNTERIYDIIKEKGKMSKPRKQVKRKRKGVASDLREHAWKKLKIVTCDTTNTDTLTME